MINPKKMLVKNLVFLLKNKELIEIYKRFY